MTKWAELTNVQKRDAVREAIVERKESYGEAALHLGTTRNAIAGVVNRSYKTDNPIPRMAAAVKRQVQQEQARKAFEHIRRKEPDVKKSKRAPRLNSFQRLPSELPIEPDLTPVLRHDAWSALPGSAPVPIDEHHDGCRWPVNDDLPFLFCNLDTQEGSVYCVGHHARAYREPPPRKDNGRRDSR